MSAIAAKHEAIQENITRAEEGGDITPREATAQREQNLSAFHDAIREAYLPCHVTTVVEEKVWKLAQGSGNRSFDAMEGIYEISMGGKDYKFTEGA